MTTLSNAPVQLTLPLPPAPDIAPTLAAADERLWAIKTRALPQAESHLAFLERVWVTSRNDAVPVFAHGEPPVPCHPAGVDRLSAAAAYASALAVEAAALTALLAAMETYAVGGPMVVGGDQQPRSPRRSRRRRTEPAGFSDLRTRTEFVRQLRQYIAAVERELRPAMAVRNAAAAADLKAELAVLHARLREEAGVVRRRPHATDVDRPLSESRKIA